MGRIGFGLRLDVQRRILTEHAEGVAVRSHLFKAIGWRLRHRIGFQTPHENAHTGNVVTARRVRRIHTPDVNGVRKPIERSVEQLERVAIAHIDCAADRDAGD